MYNDVLNSHTICRWVFLKLEEYKKIVKRYTKKESKIKNMLISFFVGGLYGVFGELLRELFVKLFNIKADESYTIVFFFIVFVSSFLTGIGVFDNIASFFKCAVIVPSSGFAHAMSASAMDHKGEGLVNGIGSNIFKMTGSIILFSIVGAFVFTVIKGVISWALIIRMFI